jgi:catechol 2,3-dioxygenase-like lactoylglutathione lyase family enzyme
MITGRKIAHIGIAVNDVKADAEWYIKMLGCETMGIFFTPNGEEVHFLKGNGVVYELFQPIVPVPEALEGKIDHLALESENIDQDYLECQKNGYEICTDGIQSIPSFGKMELNILK